jgi:zinc protease
MTARPQDLEFPDESFRAHQPASGPPHPFTLPEMQTFELPGGISVFLVEQHVLPIVSLELNFGGGTITDPVGHEGLTAVAMAMLTEGTERLDKLAYSEVLADVASSITPYADVDSQGLTMSSLTKHLDTTFALFAETLRAPGWRTADFERMIKRRLDSVRQVRANPAAIPARVSNAILFGRDHSLGAVVTEASVAAITRDACERQLAAWLQPAGARLFVVGDLTRSQLEDLYARSSLADWRGAAPAQPEPAAPRTMPGRIFFVDVPGAAQSAVLSLQLGPTRTAPDYFANTIVGAVFGGGFTSRLNMNLREDKGWAYGARGGFAYSPRQFGVFTASSSVQVDATAASLLELHGELAALASGRRPVTAAELAREQINAVLALPGMFATAQAALGRYRGLVYYGLPLDYYRTYPDRVRSVTENDVANSAGQHLRMTDTIYVVVGDGAAPQREVGQSLRQALVELAARDRVGPGGLIELDVDARPAP